MASSVKPFYGAGQECVRVSEADGCLTQKKKSAKIHLKGPTVKILQVPSTRIPWIHGVNVPRDKVKREKKRTMETLSSTTSFAP